MVAALDSTVVIVAFLTAVTAPVFVAVTQGRQRRADKREDWAREDAVAQQAKKAAELLLEANRSVTDRLVEIHTLVNSNMTDEMKRTLSALVSNLALMQEVTALHEAAGRPPTPLARAAMEDTRERIAELEAILRDRLRQTALADSQLDASKPRP